MTDNDNEDTLAPYRRLTAALYRPDVARLIIVGEAPPPKTFFYFGNSLFFRYLRLAFATVLAEVKDRDAGWFLALFREIGGWRTDICDAPQRATKGGADDISVGIDGFLACWEKQARTDDALLILSPKRLFEKLAGEKTKAVYEQVSVTVPPPGQWNAHRQAFLREMTHLLTFDVGKDALLAAAKRVDEDDARLDFEIAKACVDRADEATLRRLIAGHPRESELWGAWD